MRTKTLAFICIVLIGTGVAFGKYSGGTGDANNPYRIETAEDLNDIGNHVEDFDKCFVMVADINLAAYTGDQFNIIGDGGNPFAGVFDGNSHTIANFRYTTTGISNIGLFGVVSGTDAEIKNLRLIDPNIEAGTGFFTGAVIGYVDEGRVENCHIEGGNISGNQDVGGLLGLNIAAYISDCSFQGTVSGGDEVGGLIGFNKGIISNCTSFCTVSGEQLIGGLVGGSEAGEMHNCASSGSVTGTVFGAGGLAGYDWTWFGGGITTNCHSSVNVTGEDSVGGLIGSAWNIMSNCRATGNVVGIESVGGLAGTGDGTISECFATGSVEGDYKVGGLVGWSWPDFDGISDCYARGDVSGNKSVGGLIGRNQSETPQRSYSTSNVTGTTYVGGLIGQNDVGAPSCFWDVNTSGQATSAGGTGKTTAEMMSESMFTDAGWDFVEVWDIGENQTYPFLKTHPAGDLNHDDKVNWLDLAILAGHWLDWAGE